MAKKNRQSLKNYFTDGSMPSQENFEDLIDSMLNVIDEGFDKSPDKGFEVAQLGDSSKLISFYENIAVESPLWSIRVDSSTKNLIFGSRMSPDALTLSADATDSDSDTQSNAKIGINNNSPEFELDVEGVIAAGGRIGRKGEKPVPADGDWHDITDKLDGCQVLEVVAGVGEKSGGRYALIRAVAMNTYNNRPKIQMQKTYYGSRCNQIELRWLGTTHAFKLQLRTKCSFGSSKKNLPQVRYYLTELWFDPFMQECQPSGEEDL